MATTHDQTATNWLLQARQEDNTRTSHGWSYRTELIQIALLQEIRDLLIAHQDASQVKTRMYTHHLPTGPLRALEADISRLLSLLHPPRIANADAEQAWFNACRQVADQICARFKDLGFTVVPPDQSDPSPGLASHAPIETPGMDDATASALYRAFTVWWHTALGAVTIREHEIARSAYFAGYAKRDAVQLEGERR